MAQRGISLRYQALSVRAQSQEPNAHAGTDNPASKSTRGREAAT